MAMFEDFRGFEHLYDARITTEDGREFPVHRVLLALRSEYFHNLFCNSPKEQTDLLVPEIQGPTLEVILNYIYTGKLNFTKNNIRDILVAADFLGIEKLLNICKFLAITNLTTSNSVPLFLEGTKDGNGGIFKASSRFIQVNFERIVRDQNSRFEDLTVESLIWLLSSDSLNVLNERQLWKAVERWVSEFPEERKKWLENLILCIRFNDADSDLPFEILGHPFVKEYPSCIKLIETVSTQSAVPKHRIPKMLYFFTKSFVNRSDYAEGIKIFITYDEDIDFWRNISSKMFCPDVVLHGSGPLVVMFETAKNVVYTFDILSKTWSTLNPPNIPRWNYNVVKSGNHIYAMGGISPEIETDEIITTLERYNFDSETWEFAATHHDFAESAAATIDNKIYVVGIRDLFSEYLSAQVYDSITDIWRTISAPKTYRRLFALAVYQEQLFILGGQNYDEYLQSVEVYDADRDTWKDFENLPFSYFLPKSVTIKDILYVFDNHSGDLYDFRCPPVFWDKASLKWQVVEASSPFCDLYIYQFCTIKDSEVIMEMRKENTDEGTRWIESPFFIHLNS